MPTHTVAVWCVHVHVYTLIFKVQIIKNCWGWKVLELSSKSKMFEGFRLSIIEPPLRISEAVVHIMYIGKHVSIENHAWTVSLDLFRSLVLSYMNCIFTSHI